MKSALPSKCVMLPPLLPVKQLWSRTFPHNTCHLIKLHSLFFQPYCWFLQLIFSFICQQHLFPSPLIAAFFFDEVADKVFFPTTLLQRPHINTVQRTPCEISSVSADLQPVRLSAQQICSFIWQFYAPQIMSWLPQFPSPARSYWRQMKLQFFHSLLIALLWF